MQDVWYFTKSVDILGELAEASRRRMYEVKPTDTGILVLVDGTFIAGTSTFSEGRPMREYWVVDPIDWRDGHSISMSPEDYDYIKSFDPVSVLAITFHFETYNQLCPVLHELMLSHGGWVGLDREWVDENGSPTNILTVDTIMDWCNALDYTPVTDMSKW